VGSTRHWCSTLACRVRLSCTPCLVFRWPGLSYSATSLKTSIISSGCMSKSCFRSSYPSSMNLLTYCEKLFFSRNVRILSAMAPCCFKHRDYK
jgi:hypothetical protein